MASLSRIWPIAENTFREAIRNKLFYTLLFFAVASVGFAVLIASLSYVEGERIIQDIGIAAIRLFSVGVAIFVGIGLIHGEVVRRTVYTILSKPVTRAEFLVGKFLGLLLSVWTQLALMSTAFAGISLATGGPLDWGFAAAVSLLAAELMVIVGLTTFFSAFTTPVLAALFSLGIYVIGHSSRDLQALGQQSDSALVSSLTRWLYRVMPDLESFNLSLEAVHQLSLSWADVGLPILYGIGYTVTLLFMAVFVFRRQDMR